MNNGQQLSIYSTLDAYQAGFLKLSGFDPSLKISKANDHKIVFVFEASPELYDALGGYLNGATVSALVFANIIKTLKSQVLSMKRSNGDGKKNNHW